MKNKTVFWLLIIFSFANLIDLITAMFILPGESNPVYLLFKSPIALVILKVFLVCFCWFIYSKNNYPSRTWYYTAIYILVVGSCLYFLGAASNIYGMLNPVIIQQSAELSTSVKISYYTDFVLFLAIIPYIISIIAFKLYDSSLKYAYIRK